MSALLIEAFPPKTMFAVEVCSFNNPRRVIKCTVNHNIAIKIASMQTSDL